MLRPVPRWNVLQLQRARIDRSERRTDPWMQSLPPAVRYQHPIHCGITMRLLDRLGGPVASARRSQRHRKPEAQRTVLRKECVDSALTGKEACATHARDPAQGRIYPQRI